MPQLTRPTSDVSAGAWTTNSGGTANLYQTLDESASDDADYVRSDQVTNPDTYVLGLRTFADPGVNTGHTIRLRQRKDSAAGETTDLDVIMQAGTWDVHTESYDDIDETINAVSFTLTSDEVDEFRAHGGYATPRLKFSRRRRQSITTTTGITYATGPTRVCDIRRPSTGGPYPIVLLLVASGFKVNTFGPVEPDAIRLSREEGFATVMVGLRMAPTYIAPAPMEDCAAMIDFLVTNAATYNLDPSRIAAIGGSGGGHLAVWLADGTALTVGQFARVKCAMAASPPSDFPAYDTDGGGAPGTTNIEDFLGVTEAAGLSTWQFYSLTNRVASTSKPIMIAHATGDASVPYAQHTRFAASLAATGINYRALTRSGANHGYPLMEEAATWAEMVTWLHRYLD